MKLLKNGNVFYKNKLTNVDILTKDGKIEKIGQNLQCDFADVVDCTNKNIFPALVDIHTHGAVGFDFNTADEAGILKILEFFCNNGVGAVFPTLMTDNLERMLTQLQRIAEVSKSCKVIKGIHLEGPFLSEEFCGAMPKEFLKTPDMSLFERFQKAAGGLIKIVTIAPELPNALEFTRSLTKQDIVVSLGHSGASFEATLQALECGAKSFTHTFNAMKLPTQRQPNICGAALTSNAFCEIIPDGKHVHPEMVRLLAKSKGIDKTVAVSDSMMATGMKDGVYTLCGNKVSVQEGDAFLFQTNTRAGSTLLATDAVKNIARFCDIPLSTAICTMTENPARLVGIFDTCGSIEVGKNAEFWLENS